jgi:hypothetical protein
MKVSESDAKSLELLGPDVDRDAQRWLLSNDPLGQLFGSTRAEFWERGIKEIFGKD